MFGRQRKFITLRGQVVSRMTFPTHIEIKHREGSGGGTLLCFKFKPRTVIRRWFPLDVHWLHYGDGRFLIRS